ncbi:MAG: TatD family hydrolase [Candidatus Aminicenantes bacterium]|nr:TatD family hydrolase [Candidatus Aminicenantes bacterium]
MSDEKTLPSDPHPAPAPDSIFPDTHAHLDMPEFDPDRNEVLTRAQAAGIGAILCPIDISSERSRRITLELLRTQAWIRAAAGLHPHQAKDWSPARAEEIVGLARSGSLVAVGEIGLDYHYDFSTPAEQRRAFAEQLALAETLGLPAIIHSRLAGSDIRSAVDGENFSRGGILHCFTEDWPFAASMIDRGFWISFSGILTFPSAGNLREVAARVPLDRLLVETDAPYLAPVPYRGRVKRNEPAFAAATARFLAGLRGLDPADLAPSLRRNYEAFLVSRPAPAV